ncbi:glycosyltransferase [Aeromonas veronii]|uniref:glycosyltransferase n=1 Tax=Aeromonas veronii TaxID=654 RepID=UPI003D246FFC
MKITLYSYSYHKGGAAIAARKFYDILLSLGYEVVRVSQDNAGKFQFVLRVISYILGLCQKRDESIKHSLNLFSCKDVLRGLSQSDCIHHIHWINNDTLSVFSFDKIPQNSLITLHDEWLYCGTEHYCKFTQPVGNDSSLLRSLPFLCGYENSLIDRDGLNWRYIIWQQKLKKLSLRDDLIFTVPSGWMLERASTSQILRGKDIRVLPNPIDTEVFINLYSKEQSKKNIGFDETDILLTFGAIDCGKNLAKGAMLLISAIKILPELLPENILSRIKLVTFGGTGEQTDYDLPFPCVSYGHIKEQHKLAAIYSASDCVVVPSYVESFGQVAAEAQSCGALVVAFATSGLKDIVVDGETGYLAEPFSVHSLAEKMSGVLSLSLEQNKIMSINARQHIIDNFSYKVIGNKYNEIINEIINRNS